MAVLTKNTSTYRQTKPVYDEYRQGGSREQYRQQHESSLILHETAKKTQRLSVRKTAERTDIEGRIQKAFTGKRPALSAVWGTEKAG